MKNSSTTRLTVPTFLALAAFAAAPAFGQIYQKADSIPISAAGGANPPTELQAVVATPDGGYIAVGREGTTYLHLARYDAAANVVWSRYSPGNLPIEATTINQLGTGANSLFVVAGEVADAAPWGAWVMLIDGAGNLTCAVREINGVGPASPASRSPVAAEPLADGSYMVTGRAQLPASGLNYGRLTRFAPGCAGVMWSMLYSAGGIPGLTGACEITDVVEEPGNAYLLACGSAALANGGSVPFLLRVAKPTGAVVLAMFYGVGDPNLNLRADGLARSFDAAGNMDGYVFDGRSSQLIVGAPAPTSNYVVKVAAAGLNVLWGEVFPEFEPCHAGVRTSGSSTLLAGTRVTPNGDAGVWGSLINSATGGPIWGWEYGQGSERGNGVSITSATPVGAGGPITVGVRPSSLAAPGGFLVRSRITDGSSGGCEVPAPPPAPNGVQLPAQFSAIPVQNIRSIDLPLIPETLRAIDVCIHHNPCCNPDFNNDGDIGTDADIAAFFACLGGDCCPTCGSADFNCDGDIGTDADIASFFRVLAGGPC